MNKELYAALQNRLMKLSLKERLRLSFKYGVSLKHLDYYAHDQSIHTRKDYIAAGFETGGSPQLPGFAGRNVQFASRGTGAGGGGTKASAKKVVAGKRGGKKANTATVEPSEAAKALQARMETYMGGGYSYKRVIDKMKEDLKEHPTLELRKGANNVYYVADKGSPPRGTSTAPVPAPATKKPAAKTPSGKTKPAGTTTRKRKPAGGSKPESDTPAKQTPAQKFRARINLIKSGVIKELTPKQIANLTAQQRKEYRETVRVAKIEAKETARVEAAATKKVATDAAAAKKVTDAKAKDDAQKKNNALGVNRSKWKDGDEVITKADAEAKRLFEAKTKDNPYKVNPVTGKLTKGAIEQLKKDIEENFKQGAVYDVYRSFQKLIPMYKRLPNGDRNPEYEARVSLLRRELNKLQKEFKDNGDSFAAKSPTAPAGGPSAPAGGPTAPTAPNAPAGKRGIQINPAPVVQGKLRNLEELTKNASTQTKSTWQKIKEFVTDPFGTIDRAKLNFLERGWQSTPEKQMALAQAQSRLFNATPEQVAAFLKSRGFDRVGVARDIILSQTEYLKTPKGQAGLESAYRAQKDLAIQILAQERWGDITLRAGNSPLVRLPVPPAPSFGPRDGQGGRGRGGTAPSPPAKPSTRKPLPKPPTLRSPGKPGNATPLPRVGNPSTAIKPIARPGDAPPPGATSKPLARPGDNVPAQAKGIIGIPAGLTIAQDRKRLQDLIASGWVGRKRPAPAGSLVDLPASSAFQRIQDFIKGKS